MYLKSTYRGSDEFYLEILEKKVCKPRGFAQEEECFVVKALPNQGLREGIDTLRTSLVGSIYEMVEEIPKEVRAKIFPPMNLFDFM